MYHVRLWHEDILQQGVFLAEISDMKMLAKENPMLYIDSPTLVPPFETPYAAWDVVEIRDPEVVRAMGIHNLEAGVHLWQAYVNTIDTSSDNSH